MANNGSPALYYKEFNCIGNITSVVIPVDKDYESMKSNGNPKIKVGFEVQTQDIKRKILDSVYSKSIKHNIIKLYEMLGSEVFGNSKASEILYCSETTATKYIKRMSEELKIIAKVERAGKGKNKLHYSIKLYVVHYTLLLCLEIK